MKRFNLFFTVTNPEKIQDIIAGLQEKHMADHDCTVCDKQDICPIRNNQIDMRAILFADKDNFGEIYTIIHHMYSAPFIETIVLFDYQKDMAYIYKGKGNLSHIKTTKLPIITKLYELIVGETVFFTVEDLRLTMIGGDATLN